jgi:hypothetical protein
LDVGLKRENVKRDEKRHICHVSRFHVSFRSGHAPPRFICSVYTGGSKNSLVFERANAAAIRTMSPVIWRSKSVALLLVGSAATLTSFTASALSPHRYSSTTQPTTRSYHSSSYHSSHWYSWLDSGSSSSGYHSSGSSTSGHTSHGGFGSTGHAASS